MKKKHAKIHKTKKNMQRLRLFIIFPKNEKMKNALTISSENSSALHNFGM